MQVTHCDHWREEGTRDSTRAHGHVTLPVKYFEIKQLIIARAQSGHNIAYY